MERYFSAHLMTEKGHCQKKSSSERCLNACPSSDDAFISLWNELEAQEIAHEFTCNESLEDHLSNACVSAAKHKENDRNSSLVFLNKCFHDLLSQLGAGFAWNCGRIYVNAEESCELKKSDDVNSAFWSVNGYYQNSSADDKQTTIHCNDSSPLVLVQMNARMSSSSQQLVIKVRYEKDVLEALHMNRILAKIGAPFQQQMRSLSKHEHAAVSIDAQKSAKVDQAEHSDSDTAATPITDEENELQECEYAWNSRENMSTYYAPSICSETILSSSLNLSEPLSLDDSLGLNIGFLSGYLYLWDVAAAVRKIFFCVLQGSVLHCYERRKAYIANKRYLYHYNLRRAEDEESSRLHGFRVYTEDTFMYHFSARSDFEKKQWIFAIMNAGTADLKGHCKVRDNVSLPLNVRDFYHYLKFLFQERKPVFQLLLPYFHPNVILTSNFPRAAPFWGHFKRFDGLLYFFSTFLSSVWIENYELIDTLESDILSSDDGKIRKITVHGRETLRLGSQDRRCLTHLFVHDLWLGHDGRLVKWHLNGDHAALSMLFSGRQRDHIVNLGLPGEGSVLSRDIPPGTLYVQILKGSQIRLPLALQSLVHRSSETVQSTNNSSGLHYVYARCTILDGPHVDRTMEGYDLTEDQALPSVSSIVLDNKSSQKPSIATRFVRTIRRAAGFSGERAYARHDDTCGAVTSIAKCSATAISNEDSAPRANITLHALYPEWESTLRFDFPGGTLGELYHLKVQVFLSRFMMPDELLGTCNINLTQQLSLFDASAEAKAHGCLSSWHNLGLNFNDTAKRAEPTKFCGRLLSSIVFVPTSAAIRRQQAESLQTHDIDSILPQASRSLSPISTVYKDDANVIVEMQHIHAHCQSDDQKLHSIRLSLLKNQAHASGQPNPGSSYTGIRQRQHCGRSYMCISQKYVSIRVIGSGSYGKVLAATDKLSGVAVAIKKISNVSRSLFETKRLLREISLLRQLGSHPNIIYLYDVLISEKLAPLEDIALVTDLMETDLYRIIRSKQNLTDAHVLYFMRQIFQALQYLHSANVLHRDLKPSNILVSGDCRVKLCDLGLARFYKDTTADTESELEDLTEYVVTRWYRAPEILLDGSRYGSAADVWSAGCILAELLGRRPLFPGTSTLHQLKQIINVLGTPEPEFIASIVRPPARNWLSQQQKCCGITWESIYSGANPDALDLLDKLLRYDPMKRLSAHEALQHRYFQNNCNAESSDSFFDKSEHVFTGAIDNSHEQVPMTKSALQSAIVAEAEKVCAAELDG